MARQKSDAPSYRYHISGQACVTLDGRDFLLGEYNSPASKAKYYALLAEYNANGKRASEIEPTQLSKSPITVGCVTAEYREHVKIKYAHDKSRRKHYEGLCQLLDTEYRDLPAEEFGPRRLAEIRELFVASGNNRTYVNSQTRVICKIFQYSVSRELVDVNVLIRLKTLEPLRQGDSVASEPKRRQPVDLATVKATADHLSPVLKAMVRVQASTGMRSSEVCGIRSCDIDQTLSDTWIYRPEKHKTAHHGIAKAVPIVGDAHLALAPFMEDRASDSFCFSPRESVQWYRNQRTAKRVVSTSRGNGPGRKRDRGGLKGDDAKRKPGHKFSRDSYRQAVQSAAKQADVPAWTPYQLRYTAATAVREALGIESAQALLGHSHASMTEHYAKHILSQLDYCSILSPYLHRAQTDKIPRALDNALRAAGRFAIKVTRGTQWASGRGRDAATVY